MKYLSLLLPAFLIGCASSPVADTGNGSETTNGYMAIVVSSDNQPISGASVFVRSDDFYRDTADAAVDPIPDYSTDSEGKIRLDSVENGAVIEIRNGKREGLIFRVEKTDGNGKPDTLRLEPVSTLYGSVDRTNIDPSAKIYVQIKGVERIAQVDSTGEFSFASLPAGNHAIRIVASKKEYGVAENDTVTTRSGEQHNGGAFRLPFEYWRDSLAVRAILDSNGLTTLPVDSVAVHNKDGRIIVLNLDSLGISKLPEEIGTLRLRHLSIDDNNLDTLSDAVGKIYSLEVLSVKRNKLVFVPGSIGDIHLLKHLDFSRNLLSSLPTNIVNLTELDFLSVNRNKLSTVTAPVSSWLDTYSTDTTGGGWRESQLP